MYSNCIKHALLKRLLLLVVGLFTGMFFLFAQNKSNKGREFWLGYGHNILFTQTNAPNTQNLVLYISAEEAATVTVSINGTSFNQVVSIPANSVNSTIIIPKSGINDARILNEGFFERGIHIQSTVPIVVYAHQYGLFSSAATMLMPVETYGYTYYSLNYKQESNVINCHSWFYVIASENNTRIQITPSDTTVGGWLPNQTYTINLNKGELYNVFGKSTGTYTGKDLTGSKIVSIAGTDNQCHPIALFSGSSRMIICIGNGGEIMQQQIFPASAWGTKYVTYHSIDPSGNIATPYLNLYRVAVRDPNTIVKRNGIVLTGLVNNFYYEYTSTSGDIIEADKSILVAQYLVSTNQCNVGSSNTSPQGDPEMIFLSPIEQGIKKVVFYNTRNQFIDFNFLNIIIPASALPSLKVNGISPNASEVITHPNSNNYIVVVKRLLGVAAQHTIICDSPFIASNYGLGTTESYGYNVGTMVNNLNAITSIKNVNSNSLVDSFTCPNIPVKLFIQLAYRATSIHWRLSALNNNISPNVDSVIVHPVPTDSSFIYGRKYYTYSLQQHFLFNASGTFEIPISCTAPEVDNCNQTEAFSMVVHVKDSPIASFTFSSVNCIKDTVQLLATVSAGSFHSLIYQWVFPDNTLASGLVTQKIFSTQGAKLVQFKATAANGCIGKAEKLIVVEPNPAASIQLNGKPCVDSAILFTSSLNNISNNINYYWNFGNGVTTNTTNNSIINTYTASLNNVIVKHAVNTNGRCFSDTSSIIISKIIQNPSAAIQVLSDTFCVAKPITLNAISNSAFNTQYLWLVQQTPTVANSVLTTTFASPGNYTVALKVLTPEGCGSSFANINFTIAPNPNIDAGLSKTILANTATVLSTSVQSIGNYTYKWTPNIYMNHATILNPTVQPPASITYYLQATDVVHKCFAKDSVEIIVLQKINIPNAFSPNGDGVNDVWQIDALVNYPNSSVEVYARSGQLVYQSNNGYSNPWDGKKNGQSLPIGVYYYIIQLKNTNEVYKGSVTLLR